MPNTIARPMSPAVGVNYDRNHMREIYQKKSIAYKCLKRCMDISLSGLALIVLSPVFLVTAAAIRLEDHGPVFFTQTRAGKDMKYVLFHTCMETEIHSELLCRQRRYCHRHFNKCQCSERRHIDYNMIFSDLENS
mgnify:CR=1 FL=1